MEEEEEEGQEVEQLSVAMEQLMEQLTTAAPGQEAPCPAAGMARRPPRESLHSGRQEDYK